MVDPIQLLLQNASSACCGLEFLGAGRAVWRCEASRGKGKRGVSCNLAGKQMSVQSSSQGSGFSRRLPAWRREAIPALFLLLHSVYVWGEPLLLTPLLLPRKLPQSSQDFIPAEITQPQSPRGPQCACVQEAHASGSHHATAILGFAQQGV